MPELTRSERRAAQTLLARYPTVGLESITGFAETARVSSATIQRFVTKLGVTGYPEFRRLLRDEVSVVQENALTVQRVNHDETRRDERLRKSLVAAVETSLSAFDLREFAEVVELLADTRRRVFLLGGTFTLPVAMHLDFHLRKMRPRVTLMTQDMPRRCDALIEMRRNDLFVVFDIRRYQPDIILTAKMASEKGGVLILFTDQWVSDVEAFARHTFRCKVDATTPWDTIVGLVALVEMIVAELDVRLWPTAQPRLEALNRLRERTFVPDRRHGGGK
ncbi:MAG: MurR/RpiR family transcriptional regulator [Mesorhizobium sp.]|nr:MAG: MurR/RpiR family transcriptional regulator [Mesorhizobium sp.]